MAGKQTKKQKKTLSSRTELAEARHYFQDMDRLLSPPIMRAAYSDRMAWILSSMSHLAYDRFEDDEKARELFIAKLEGGGFRLVEFFHSKETDTQAFLATNDEYAVLAFRGTEVTKRQDVKTDILANQIAVLEGKMNEAGPITARLKFPPNYRLPAHFHGGVERVTVLSGTLNFGMGDKFERSKTTAIGPGSLVLMPPKMTHFLWTTEEAVAQINVTGPWTVTYVNPADDPRKK